MMRSTVALTLAGLSLLVAGCGPSEAEREARSEEIRTLLEQYLPLLAEAYVTGDVEPLRGLAAQKEVASVAKRISDLRGEGRVLKPTFRELNIETIDVWHYANAFVTTVEVWDLASYAAGSERLLAQQLNQRNRVKYQLKREGGDWQVLFRTIQE